MSRRPAPGAPGPQTSRAATLQALTAPQREVVAMLLAGLRHAEIAAHMGISARQVARLAAQARERTTSTTTSQLVALIVNATDGRATERRPGT